MRRSALVLVAVLALAGGVVAATSFAAVAPRTIASPEQGSKGGAGVQGADPDDQDAGPGDRDSGPGDQDSGPDNRRTYRVAPDAAPDDRDAEPDDQSDGDDDGDAASGRQWDQHVFNSCVPSAEQSGVSASVAEGYCHCVVGVLDRLPAGERLRLTPGSPELTDAAARCRPGRSSAI